MNTQEIANFIKSQLKMNSSRAEIEHILSLNQISPQEIAAAFELAGKMPEAAPTPSSPVPESPASKAEPVFPPPPAPTGGETTIATPKPEFTPKPGIPNLGINTIPTSPQIPMASMAASTAGPDRSGAGKWLALFVFLVIILAGAAGAYAYFVRPELLANLPFQVNLASNNTEAVPPIEESFTPPPAPVDPTADWLTYRNEKYGFEFKYPTNWVIVGTSSLNLIGLKDGELASSSTSTMITFDPSNKSLILADINYQSVYDQIISTFRFIEPAATSTATSTTATTSAETTPGESLPSLFLNE